MEAIRLGVSVTAGTLPHSQRFRAASTFSPDNISEVAECLLKLTATQLNTHSLPFGAEDLLEAKLLS